MASYSSTSFTNSTNMDSPTIDAQLDKLFDVLKRGAEGDYLKEDIAKYPHADLVVSEDEDEDEDDLNEDMDGYVFFRDEASNYDDVDSTTYLYDFDYDTDADSSASCWPAPLKLRKPDEYLDLAATSPYDEEFAAVDEATRGTIAARRGRANLCIQPPAAIDFNDNDASSARPVAVRTSGLLPTSKHHQRVKEQQQQPQQTAAPAALQGLLKRMDQQSLNLTESVARWEASIAREMLEMELEMELERELKVFESGARAGERDIVELFESEIEELDQHLQRYPEDKDADELLCMRTVIERKRQAVVADRRRSGDECVTPGIREPASSPSRYI